MKHIVVDLEMNDVRKKSDARRICKMETIEIGAVMLDDNMNEVASFQTYVKPEYNDGVEKRIVRLTGITDDKVMNAPRFKEALHMFIDWCLSEGDDVMIYAWSESDYAQIAKEMTLKEYEISESESKVLNIKWFDFQQEFDSHLGFEKKMSLKTALDMAGIDFSGKEHDALDDARNTAGLLQVFKDEELFDKTLRKISEVMKPSTIGSTIGDLIDFSKFVCA